MIYIECGGVKVRVRVRGMSGKLNEAICVVQLLT